MMNIHPTALIDDDAQVAENVSIGPFCIVEGGTTLGANTVLRANVHVRKGTRLGPNCTVETGAVLGGDPQALGFNADLASYLEIGEGSVIREHVTLHRSMNEGGATRLGARVFCMAGSHVGHDSSVGDDTVIANQVMIAGHVEIGSRCFIGGGAGFHQYVRIGDLVMVQGNAGISLDIAPYLLVSGANRISGFNAVGMRRAGIEKSSRLQLKQLYRTIFHREEPLKATLAALPESFEDTPSARFVAFFRAESTKGVCSRLKSADS